MCGIVGYFTKKKDILDQLILKKLVKESRIRGLHSFGLSYYSNGILIADKYFQKEFQDIKIPDSNSLIFHNRYSTSGDFKEHKNNQPILINGTSLVFNGVIDMGTKSEIESKWDIQMETDNDGEIILKKSNFDVEKMVEFVSNIGSFSGLILQDGNLYAFTNGNRPLWVLQRGESFFFASTKDIFKRAIPFSEPEKLKINTLHKWNFK